MLLNDFLSLFGKHFYTSGKNSIGRLTEEIQSHASIAARSKSILIVTGLTPVKVNTHSDWTYSCQSQYS